VRFGQSTEVSLVQVRMKLNSLSTAFGRRSEEQASSHTVHNLSLGTFALENALQEGLPLDAGARALQVPAPHEFLHILYAVPSILYDIYHHIVIPAAPWYSRDSKATLLVGLPDHQSLVPLHTKATLATRLHETINHHNY